MSNYQADPAKRPVLARSSMALGVIATITAAFVLMTTAAGDSDAATPPGFMLSSATALAPRPQALPTAVQPAAPAPAVVRREPATSRSGVRQDQPVPTPAAAPVADAPVPSTPVKTAQPAPAARTIRIAAQATPQNMQRQLDRCIGAIQVNWLTHSPEIAQHSNCGGAWYAGVRAGDRIDVRGGTLTGSYQANGRRRTVSKGSNSSVLDGLGDVVLQTCIGDRMVLVGLSRI